MRYSDPIADNYYVTFHLISTARMSSEVLNGTY